MITEIRKTGRGFSVLVTDENGNPVRHPMKMGDFKERPRFYLSEHQTLNQHYKQNLNSSQTELGIGLFKSLIVKELIRKVNLYNSDYQRNAKQKLRFQIKKGKKL